MGPQPHITCCKHGKVGSVRFRPRATAPGGQAPHQHEPRQIHPPPSKQCPAKNTNNRQASRRQSKRAGRTGYCSLAPRTGPRDGQAREERNSKTASGPLPTPVKWRTQSRFRRQHTGQTAERAVQTRRLATKRRGHLRKQQHITQKTGPGRAKRDRQPGERPRRNTRRLPTKQPSFC